MTKTNTQILLLLYFPRGDSTTPPHARRRSVTRRLRPKHHLLACSIMGPNDELETRPRQLRKCICLCAPLQRIPTVRAQTAAAAAYSNNRPPKQNSATLQELSTVRTSTRPVHESKTLTAQCSATASAADMGDMHPKKQYTATSPRVLT